MRSYIRLDPRFPDRKEHYPDGALAAFTLTLCYAEQQPDRGRFKPAVLRALLGRRAKWIRHLLEHGDLVEQEDGQLYVDGWTEWQEGDWQVRERMRRVRDRKQRYGPNRNGAVDRNASVRAVGGDYSGGGGGSSTSTAPASSTTLQEQPKQKPSDAVHSQTQAELTTATLSEPAAEVLMAYEELGYRVQPADILVAEDVVSEFGRRMSGSQIASRMRHHASWCEQNRRRKPGSLRGFVPTIRHEADHISDTQPPPRRTANGGMQGIGSVLEGA